MVEDDIHETCPRRHRVHGLHEHALKSLTRHATVDRHTLLIDCRDVAPHVTQSRDHGGCELVEAERTGKRIAEHLLVQQVKLISFEQRADELAHAFLLCLLLRHHAFDEACDLLRPAHTLSLGLAILTLLGFAATVLKSHVTEGACSKLINTECHCALHEVRHDLPRMDCIIHQLADAGEFLGVEVRDAGELFLELSYDRFSHLLVVVAQLSSFRTTLHLGIDKHLSGGHHDLAEVGQIGSAACFTDPVGHCLRDVVDGGRTSFGRHANQITNGQAHLFEHLLEHTAGCGTRHSTIEHVAADGFPLLKHHVSEVTGITVLGTLDHCGDAVADQLVDLLHLVGAHIIKTKCHSDALKLIGGLGLRTLNAHHVESFIEQFAQLGLHDVGTLHQWACA